MSTTFTSHGTVHSQAGLQTIHGSSYHGPVYTGPVHYSHPEASPKNRRLSENRRPLSKIPFSRDARFIPRQAIFDKIEEAVQNTGSVAIHGLGGIGKSQIAIEYAYRFSDLHPKAHVLWLCTGTNDRIVQEYQAISRRLRLEGYDDPKEDQCQLVLDWLEEEDNAEADGFGGKSNGKQWLIILDNLDDSATLHQPLHAVGSAVDIESPVSKTLWDYLPQLRDSEHILFVTTRNEDVAREVTEDDGCIQIEPFTSEEAHDLFVSRLGKHRMDLDDRRAIYPLVDHLGCIPLAISQAAAYVIRCRVTVTNYLVRLNQNDEQLSTHLTIELQDSRRQKGWPNSIFRTWKLSFDQIQKNHPEAADLLALMAILDGQEIPRSLLSAYVAHPSVLEMALGTLYGYSLVSDIPQSSSVSVHPLVQSSVRFWLAGSKNRTKLIDRAIEILAAAFPQGEHENQQTCRALLPHASSVLRHHARGEAENRQYAELLYRLSWYLWRCGTYAAAYQYAISAHDTWRVLLGQQSAQTLDALSLAALLLRYQGKYAEAREMSQAALEGREKLLGAKHPHTLTSVHNLAGALESQGMYEEAEVMSRRALEFRREVLGENHADTLVTLSHLALIRQHRGSYEEAEKYTMQALEGRRKALGPEHPHTLTSTNNLGILLLHRGKFNHAEDMCQQALQGRTKALGPDHPHTLSSMSNLANVYESQGFYQKAEEINRRVLQGRQKMLGAEHPDTLTSVSNLASLLHSQGKFEEAAAMNEEALDGLEKVLGIEHPHTLIVASNTVRLLCSQGIYDEAEELCRTTMETMERTIGPQNPRTLSGAGDLASVLEYQGQYKQAEQMYRDLKDKSEQALGADHPQTLTFISNLACTLRHQGKYHEASDQNLRVLYTRETVLGPAHPDTWKSLSQHALICQDLGSFKVAESLIMRELGFQEQSLGLGHPQTLSTMCDLALLFQRQRRYKNAEEVFRSALAHLEKLFGRQHRLTLSCIENLATVLRRQAKSAPTKLKGNYLKEAEDLILEAVVLSEKAVGRSHPDTLRLIDTQAAMAVAKEDDVQAEKLIREVFTARKRALGHEHPLTLTTLNSLAIVLKNQGEDGQARKCLRRVLEGREEVLGRHHPSTIETMMRLAQLLASQGCLRQCSILSRKAFLRRRKILGPRHAQTQQAERCCTSILFFKRRLRKNSGPMYEAQKRHDG